jgi:hypothetical protein
MTNAEWFLAGFFAACVLWAGTLLLIGLTG